jgi:hypothetical protein
MLGDAPIYVQPLPEPLVTENDGNCDNNNRESNYSHKHNNSNFSNNNFSANTEKAIMEHSNTEKKESEERLAHTAPKRSEHKRHTAAVAKPRSSPKIALQIVFNVFVISFSIPLFALILRKLL